MFTSRSKISTAAALAALACAVAVPGAQARLAMDPPSPTAANVHAPAPADRVGTQPSAVPASVVEPASQSSPATGGSSFDWTLAAAGLAALFALGLLVQRIRPMALGVVAARHRH